MQTCILTFGILLAGQLSEPTGNRYQPSSQPQSIGGSSTPAIRPTFDNNPPHSTAASSGSPSATAPPASAPTRLAKVVKPTELLSTLVKPVGKDALAGQQLSLAGAVQGASSRAEQTRRVKLYWELSQAVAEHHLVSLEAVQLNSIYHGLGLTQPDEAWQQVQQTLAARTQVTRSAVRLAQLSLQKELGKAGEINLPLPSDLPLCGAYETRFVEIFRERGSGEAEQLSQLLSLCYLELSQRTLDVMAAQEWYKSRSQQRSPQSDGEQLLKAYEYLAHQRRAFVLTAYQYNENIVRYTELAVPQDVGVMRLVAMLIESDGDPSVNWQSSGIRRASSEEPLPKASTPSSQPRTYAERGTARSLRVPIGEDGAERSILVPPKNVLPPQK